MMFAILHLYKITINSPNSTSFIPCCGDFSPIYSPLPLKSCIWIFINIIYKTVYKFDSKHFSTKKRSVRKNSQVDDLLWYVLTKWDPITECSDTLKDSHKKRKTNPHNIMEVNQMQSC